MADMCRKGLHEMTPENTYVDPRPQGGTRCRACNRERDRARYTANPERKKELNRAYYWANRERRMEYNRAYREANRDRLREQARAYREANCERIRICEQVRYATDADYREAMKQSARERYAANRKPQPTTITIPASLDDAAKRLGGGQ